MWSVWLSAWPSCPGPAGLFQIQPPQLSLHCGNHPSFPRPDCSPPSLCLASPGAPQEASGVRDQNWQQDSGQIPGRALPGTRQPRAPLLWAPILPPLQLSKLLKVQIEGPAASTPMPWTHDGSQSQAFLIRTGSCPSLWPALPGQCHPAWSPNEGVGRGWTGRRPQCLCLACVPRGCGTTLGVWSVGVGDLGRGCVPMWDVGSGAVYCAPQGSRSH